MTEHVVLRAGAVERASAVQAEPRSAPGAPGRDERWGLGGHVGGATDKPPRDGVQRGGPVEVGLLQVDEDPAGCARRGFFYVYGLPGEGLSHLPVGGAGLASGILPFPQRPQRRFD